MTRLVVLAVIAIVLAFLVAAGEASLARVSRVRAAELVEEGKAGARAVVRVVGDRAAYLALLAFLRVLAETTAAVMVTFVVVNRLDQTWSTFAIAIGIMTVVSFVIVGVSPRTIGTQHASEFARHAAPVALWLRRLLGPVSTLLVVVGNAVTPGKGFRDGPFESESELRYLVDIAGDSDVIEAGERKMIHSVFELGDTLTREVMVPRTDMVVLDEDRTARQGLNLMLRSGYSRVPVVGEDTDDILGILYLKDVARRVTVDPAGAAVPVPELMRPAFFVPESKPADDLLTQMQRDQIHVAIVIDEYGGTAGVVTLEDVVEEIVGEISDEHDPTRARSRQRRDGSWVVSGLLRPDEVEAQTGLDLPEDDDYDTIAGLLIKLLGRIPQRGDVVTVPLLKDLSEDDDDELPDEFAELTVLAMEGLRVDRISVRRVTGGESS